MGEGGRARFSVAYGADGQADIEGVLKGTELCFTRCGPARAIGRGIKRDDLAQSLQLHPVGNLRNVPQLFLPVRAAPNITPAVVENLEGLLGSNSDPGARRFGL